MFQLFSKNAQTRKGTIEMLHAQKAEGCKGTERHLHVPRLLFNRARTLCRPGLALFILLLLAVSVFPQGGTSHSIKVAWTYTQGSDIATGFNVYRGVVSGGPYTKQNSTSIPITTLSYSDTTGTGGTKYFYVITATDALGDESAYSSEASAIFLANPSVPQGVTATAQ